MTRPEPTTTSLDRRRVLGAPALAAAAVTGAAALGSTAPAAAQRRPRPARPPVEVGLAEAPVVTDAGEFAVLGVTWPRGERPPEVEVSVRRAGSWGPWLTLPGPAHGDATEGTREGTEPLWVGRADGVRTRLRSARARAADTGRARLVLVDPGESSPEVLARAVAEPGDTDEAPDAARSRRRGGVPQPRMLRRRDWGANERWRTSDPRYNRVLKQVHVHHSASGNGYSRGDVPAIIRGFYRYHTQSLGWSDIGYNFLVDRFGRIWVGRAGGAAKRVRGAHTLGFNKQSTGVCIIGNHQQRDPSRAALRAVAKLAAWKLDMAGINPRQTVRVRSTGSDKYAAGRRVRLPAIDGHRDTNDTACPGNQVYRRLRRIRRRAKAIIERHRS